MTLSLIALLQNFFCMTQNIHKHMYNYTQTSKDRPHAKIKLGITGSQAFALATKPPKSSLRSLFCCIFI